MGKARLAKFQTDMTKKLVAALKIPTRYGPEISVSGCRQALTKVGKTARKSASMDKTMAKSAFFVKAQPKSAKPDTPPQIQSNRVNAQ